jgi:cytochrome c biogenesis protein CcmG, thiol:disulfide interchange protein DsbE
MSDVDGGEVAPVVARARVAPILAAGIAVVLALFVWLLATRDTGDRAATSSPLIGKLAPAIIGSGFRGEAFDLDDARGQWVIVNFFSTTCVPCEIEHPHLVELERRHAERRDLAIVSVTFEDRPEKVRDFFETNGGDWPVLLENTGPIAISYGVRGVPESYIISPGGLVARKIIGGITADGIDQLLAKLEG